MALARCTSATSTISMATMLSSSSSPAAVPRTIASMVEVGDAADLDLADVGALAGRVRHHQHADQQRRRRAQDRGDQNVAGDVGNGGAQDGRIEHEHGAGDAGHAAGHHHEQFAAREAR